VIKRKGGKERKDQEGAKKYDKKEKRNEFVTKDNGSRKIIMLIRKI